MNDDVAQIAPSNGTKKKRAVFIRILSELRIVIAVLLLGLILYLVNIRDVLNALSHLRLIYVFYLLILGVALIWLSSIKWRLFIRAAGHEVPLLRLMTYYTTAYFFNMFFPSMLGGDVARGMQVGRDVNSHSSALAATFVERVTGFLAMTLLGVLFVAIGAQATAGLEGAILLVAFLAAFGTLVCFSRPLSSFFFALGIKFSRLLGFSRLAAKLEKLFALIAEAMNFVHDDFALFYKAMALSFLFHLFAVLNTYVAAMAVGWHDADFGGLCIVVPLVLLVGIVPLTPASIGISDGAFIFLLERVGATYAQGFGVSLILRAKNVVCALIGGVLWAFIRPPSKKSGAAKV